MLESRSVWQKVAGESSLYQLPSIFLSRTSNQRLNIKRLCVVPTFKMAEVNWFFALATFSHSFNLFNEYFLFQDIVKHSVHTLVFRSLKRSHDMFLHDNALPLKRDQKRQCLKISYLWFLQESFALECKLQIFWCYFRIVIY